MHPLKQATLASYYHATRPLRKLRNRRLARAGHAPIMVVMYHRIADDCANSWTTHPDVFSRGIDWMQQHFDLISLEDARHRMQSSANHRPAIAITFDDGYAVNCESGLPLLLDRKIPFTYFVTSDAVMLGRSFPHDLKMGNRLEPNTIGQIKELADAGVEIGGHTRSHCNLGEIHDDITLYDEIVTSARDVEDAIGRPVRYFAFPFGQHQNLNRRGFQIAADAGFEAVVSAYGGYNFPGDNPFHLQRMGVDGPLVRLKNWTTLDPVKQWKIQRFELANLDGTTTLEARVV
jgi:peptidoglycan/xylan/chitin deacetylase (PgdA/CDA1 family)